jgi:hypothetical protein
MGIGSQIALRDHPLELTLRVTQRGRRSGALTRQPE